MCYISICLRHSQGSDSDSNGPSTSDIIDTPSLYSDDDISSELGGSTHPMSQPLLDYVLRTALEHFEYFGSRIGSVLHDIKVLEEDIDRHFRVWDTEYFSCASWDYMTPSWPTSTHDLTLYILVVFASSSLLRAYLPRPVPKLKKGTNPLIYAAHFDKHEQARTLLSRGVKLNCMGWELDNSIQALPIEVALHNGHYSMVAFFVAEGSIVSPQIFSRLFLSYYGMMPASIMRILLQTDDFAEAVSDPKNNLNLGRDFLKYHDLFKDHIRGKDLIDLVRRMIQVSHDSFRCDLCGNDILRLSPGTSPSRNILTQFSILRRSTLVKTRLWGF